MPDDEKKQNAGAPAIQDDPLEQLDNTKDSNDYGRARERESEELWSGIWRKAGFDSDPAGA